jgi:pantoate--beta-alanine ligase
MTKLISVQPSARIDYISIADAQTLNELPTLTEKTAALVSLAVRIGSTRLIDNLIL